MEGRHIIQLIPAGVPAGIVPHAVAAPAVIDLKFIDIIAPVTYVLFLEYLFDEVDHVSGIVRPVIAAIDEEDIKFLTVKPEFLFIPDLFELPAGTGTLRAFIRRTVPLIDEPAHVAFPAVSGERAGRFRILGYSRRHVKIPPLQAPGMPGRDILSPPVCRCFYRLLQDKRQFPLYNPQNSGIWDTYIARLPFSCPWS